MIVPASPAAWFNYWRFHNFSVSTEIVSVLKKVHTKMVESAQLHDVTIKSTVQHYYFCLTIIEVRAISMQSC